MPLRDTGHPRSARRRRLGPCLLAAGGLATALAVAPAGAATASASPIGPPAARPGLAVVAWGSNADGQLGDGTTANSDNPRFAELPTSLRYTTVRTGLTSIALSTSGRVYGWGSNKYGQIGDGTTTSRKLPVRATKLRGVRVTALRGGDEFTMALTSTGKVLAWGNNAAGQLGDGTTRNRLTPVRVKIPKGATITAISTGFNNGLALTRTGRVLAWGGGAAGQLGDGTGKNRHTPVYVRLPPHTKISSIAAGNETGYAVTSTGRLLAWGYNGQGGLGDGTTKQRLKPVQVRLPKGVKVVAATAGLGHALALTTDGRALAWGWNAFGQLGDASTSSRLVPVWVMLPNGTKIRALAGGGTFSMALTTGGRVLAWGSNDTGQLGTGNTASSTTPVRVHLPAGFKPTAIGAGWDAETGLAIGNAPVA